MVEELPPAAPVEPEPTVEPAGHLDGPPPSAPSLPPRARPTPRPAAAPPVPAGEGESKPFFLDDAAPPRLFGRTDDAAPAEAPAPAPAPARTPAPTRTPAPAPAPEPVPAAAAPAPAAPVAEATTTSGLKRRTPREAGAGAGSRAIPGADGERGVSATRRSPDEVRNLLSGFRAGQQRARTEEPVPTGSPEEKEPNE